MDSVDGTTIRNCVLSWSAVYNWKSPNTTLDDNVMTNIQTTTAPMGSTVNGWGGWNEGDCSRSATGMRILNNTITSIAVEHAVFFGGYCSGWIDNSDLYIDGNTIVSPACGVAFWQSEGSNKVMTCNNTVTAPWRGVCVWSSTYDGPDDWDSDGDGVLDCDDQCPDSDLSSTVVIDDCDTGVENKLLDDGCTISDRIAECAESARNHGGFVSCVAHLTNDLVRAGYITGREKGAIQSCAAKADIP